MIRIYRIGFAADATRAWNLWRVELAWGLLAFTVPIRDRRPWPTDEQLR